MDNRIKATTRKREKAMYVVQRLWNRKNRRESKLNYVAGHSGTRL